MEKTKFDVVLPRHPLRVQAALTSKHKEHIKHPEHPRTVINMLFVCADTSPREQIVDIDSPIPAEFLGERVDE